MKNDLGGIFSLVLFVAIMWLGWPISLWLMIAIICAAVFKVLAEEDKEPSARSFSTTFKRTAMPALSSTAVCIAVGIGIVTLAQMLFSVTGMFSSATVLSWEAGVASAQRQFAQWLSPFYVLTILAALLLLTIVWPQFSLVGGFVKLKKWASRTLLVLTTITAFTFFSSMAVSTLEPRWFAARKTQAHEAMTAVASGRKELVTLAWLEETFKTFPNDKKEKLGAFLMHISDTNDPDAISEAAVKFVQTAPILKRDDTGASPDSFDLIGPWVEEKGPAPSLDAIIDTSAEAEKINAELPPARIAAEEVLKVALGSLVPKTVDPLLRPFIKALSDALVKTRLSKFSLPEVHNHETAVAFVRRKMRPMKGGTSQTMAQLWHWRFPRIEEPAPEIPPGVGDGAGSSSISNAQPQPGGNGSSNPVGSVVPPHSELSRIDNPSFGNGLPNQTYNLPPPVLVVPPYVPPVAPFTPVRVIPY